MPKKKPPKHDWSQLPDSEKTRIKHKSMKWLADNYDVDISTSISKKKLYEHYVKFCNSEWITIPPLESTFGRYVIKQFPMVKIRRLGLRKNTSYYYSGIAIKSAGNEPCAGLDSFKLSDAHHKIDIGKTVSVDAQIFSKENCIMDEKNTQNDDVHTKTNTVEMVSKMSTEFRNKSNEHLKQDTSGDCNDELNIDNMDTDTCESKHIVDKWKSLSSDEKKSHRSWAMNWATKEYEINPSNCLLRTSVYHHYKTDCSNDGQPVLPYPQFGKTLLQAFKNISVRRLGSRGESQYYYLGIEIRDESNFCDIVNKDRIISEGAKPKVSRVFNGPRKK